MYDTTDGEDAPRHVARAPLGVVVACAVRVSTVLCSAVMNTACSEPNPVRVTAPPARARGGDALRRRLDRQPTPEEMLARVASNAVARTVRILREIGHPGEDCDASSVQLALKSFAAWWETGGSDDERASAAYVGLLRRARATLSGEIRSTEGHPASYDAFLRVGGRVVRLRDDKPIPVDEADANECEWSIVLIPAFRDSIVMFDVSSGARCRAACISGC